MEQREIKQGIIFAGFSYVLWGLLPIYWKLLGEVSSGEIMANRVVWSFVFMAAIVFLTGKWGALRSTVKNLASNKKQALALVLASLLISCNWFIYIWAVNSGRMIEASLGYYINPLVSVLLGMIVFKERHGKLQFLSFGLALTGVVILTISYGQFPWASMLLAFSFGFYGLVKKLISVDSSIGLTLETLVAAPAALVYMIMLLFKNTSSFLHVSLSTDLLLIGAGAATAIPLLYFAKGAQKIPLSTLGFLQYIAPTLTLLLGIFVYGETFSPAHFVSFAFIWSALTVYSISKMKIFSIWQEKRARQRVGA